MTDDQFKALSRGIAAAVYETGGELKLEANDLANLAGAALSEILAGLLGMTEATERLRTLADIVEKQDFERVQYPGGACN